MTEPTGHQLTGVGGTELLTARRVLEIVHRYCEVVGLTPKLREEYLECLDGIEAGKGLCELEVPTEPTLIEMMDTLVGLGTPNTLSEKFRYESGSRLTILRRVDGLASGELGWEPMTAEEVESTYVSWMKPDERLGRIGVAGILSHALMVASAPFLSRLATAEKNNRLVENRVRSISRIGHYLELLDFAAGEDFLERLQGPESRFARQVVDSLSPTRAEDPAEQALRLFILTWTPDVLARLCLPEAAEVYFGEWRTRSLEVLIVNALIGARSWHPSMRSMDSFDPAMINVWRIFFEKVENWRDMNERVRISELSRSRTRTPAQDSAEVIPALDEPTRRIHRLENREYRSHHSTDFPNGAEEDFRKL